MKPLILQNRQRAVAPVQGIRDAEAITLKGDWWLVMPETARDIFFVQILGSHERFANYSGEGILISDNAIPKHSQN